MVGFITDHIDDIIDGDTTEQLVVFIDDRCGYQVVVLEQARHIGALHGGQDAFDIPVHDFGHAGIGVAGQQGTQRQQALEVIKAVDHEQAVGQFRDFTAQPQVTQHDVQ